MLSHTITMILTVWAFHIIQPNHIEWIISSDRTRLQHRPGWIPGAGGRRSKPRRFDEQIAVTPTPDSPDVESGRARQRHLDPHHPLEFRRANRGLWSRESPPNRAFPWSLPADSNN